MLGFFGQIAYSQLCQFSKKIIHLCLAITVDIPSFFICYMLGLLPCARCRADQYLVASTK